MERKEIKAKKSKRKMKYSTSRQLNGFVFMLPWIIGFIMFFAYPVIQTIYFSFNKVQVADTGGYTLTFRGIQNYIDIFVKELSIEDFPLGKVFAEANSEIFMNLPVIVIFSLFLAIIANMKFKGRGIVRMIFFMPIILGLDLIVEWTVENTTQGQMLIEAATGNMFGRNEGRRLLLDLVPILPPAIVQFITGIVASIFKVITQTGVQTMIFLAGLQSISPSHYEVAKLEGANTYETFWKVTLPMVANILMFVVVYTLIDLFLKSPIAKEVYNFAFGRSNIGVGSALSVVYMLNVLAGLCLVLLFLRMVNVIEKK